MTRKKLYFNRKLKYETRPARFGHDTLNCKSSYLVANWLLRDEDGNTVTVTKKKIIGGIQRDVKVSMGYSISAGIFPVLYSSVYQIYILKDNVSFQFFFILFLKQTSP